MKRPQFIISAAIILLSLVSDGAGASQFATDPPAVQQNATKLVESAKKGDLRAIQLTLASGVDVNGKSKNGETALAAAAGSYESYDEIVNLLLERGARVDKRSRGPSAIRVDVEFGFHEVPLPSYAIRCGNTRSELADEYSKVDTIGVTALLAAASERHPKIVERLLNAGAAVDATTFELATPLMLATILNDIQSMRVLIERGANVNATAKRGQTALMLASWSDRSSSGVTRIEAFRLLVDSGALINAQDEEGRSALMGAAEADNREAATFLLSKGPEVNAKSKKGRTALMQAAYAGNVDMLRLLVAGGADVNARDDNGTTALVEAAFLHRKPEAVAVLLEAGAMVQAKENNGVTTALLVVELAGRDDAVRELRQAGAALTDDGALILAASRGQTASVQTLLDRGSNPNARDSDGKPVLMYAALVDNPTVTRLLIERGADVNASSEMGATALMVASSNGSVAVAKLLIERGADINARSKGEMTALMKAAWSGKLEIVQVLIDEGADVNVESKSGNTALEMSMYAGRNRGEIARILKKAGAKK